MLNSYKHEQHDNLELNVKKSSISNHRKFHDGWFELSYSFMATILLSWSTKFSYNSNEFNGRTKSDFISLIIVKLLTSQQ